MVAVYHDPNAFTREAITHRPTVAQVKAGFTHVANVETPGPAPRYRDLEKAFQLTNSIDRHWSENPGVTTFGPKTRSTSVGDAMLDEDGEWWRIESFGFFPLGRNDAPELKPSALESSPDAAAEWAIDARMAEEN